MTPRFSLYSRPGCHLCEQLLEEVLPLLRGRAAIEVINIDEDAELQQRFGTRIPVLALADTIVCEARLDLVALQAALAGISAET